MTQPSLNTTFDTSLLDLRNNIKTAHSSFSTTNSDPSMYNQSTVEEKPDPSSQETAKATTMPLGSAAHKVEYLQTTDAYNEWASVYDTDGNMLQAMDDIELSTMLPDFISSVLSKTTGDGKTLNLVDLGCGTARNTLKLLSYPWPSDLHVDVVGLDASEAMLERARSKADTFLASALPSRRQNLEVEFVHCDCLDPSATKVLEQLREADAVISTLVLEHLPLSTFFTTLATLLRPGGLTLVTNMHPEMGAKSQAGFVRTDPATGEKVKVRGTSYVHGVAETLDAAKEHGFEVVGEVVERAVDDKLVERLGERGKKWVGCRVWYGMMLRKAG